MKKSGLIVPLLPLVITISLYLEFSTRIATKPSNAGFWIILSMGMALGVALTWFFNWLKNK